MGLAAAVVERRDVGAGQEEEREEVDGLDEMLKRGEQQREGGEEGGGGAAEKEEGGFSERWRDLELGEDRLGVLVAGDKSGALAADDSPSTLFGPNGPDWNAVFQNSEITPAIQSHLVNVYATLAAGVLCCAFASFVFVTTGFGGRWASLVGLGVLIWLKMTAKEKPIRFLLFLAFCALEGLAIGPLIGAMLVIDPHIISTALLGTATVFVCFSGAAMLAKRRSLLFLGGILSTSLSWMLFASLLNYYFGLHVDDAKSLYFGLLVFCGYIVFDTQLMIERASRGSANVIDDAVGLFLNLLNIFIRIVAILAKKKKDKEEQKNRET